MTNAPRGRGDRGETLIEILISVAIMGIVMVGLITSLTTATIAGDTHRRLSDVEVVARDYGEAVVAQALHPAITTTLATAFKVTRTKPRTPGQDTVAVASTAGFAANASVSVDGEVLVVKTVSASNLIFTTDLVADHATGSTVSNYRPCPTASAMDVSTFTHAAAQVGNPNVTLVEFFAHPASPSVAPAQIISSDCGNYWFNTGLPCALDEDSTDSPRPHYTACDPPIIRLTISVNSTDAVQTGRGAATTTKVFVNRGNT